MLAWLVVGLGAAAVRADSKLAERLPLKSATISYGISGIEKGSETLYLDDAGRRLAIYRETVSTMLGMAIQNKTVEIVDENWAYSYDPVEEVGTKNRRKQ